MDAVSSGGRSWTGAADWLLLPQARASIKLPRRQSELVTAAKAVNRRSHLDVNHSAGTRVSAGCESDEHECDLELFPPQRGTKSDQTLFVMFFFCFFSELLSK